MKKKPPEPHICFIDRNLGRNVVIDALKAAGVLVELHDDHFPQTADDVKWVWPVTERGWIILTRDAMIARRPLER